MGTYYVDNDVGVTGGSGTPADPYGIETAIAAAQPGDVFYWRGGGEGDVSPGHKLNFNRGGSSAAPVRWIGTDDDWAPIPVGQTPTTGVDGNDGTYPIVEISTPYQIFESVRIHNAEGGRYGGVGGCYVNASRMVMRNCVADDCGLGFYSAASANGLLFAQCRSHNVYNGFSLNPFTVLCHSCVVNDADGDAFRFQMGGICVYCRAYDLGGRGVELYYDSSLPRTPLLVDHFSAYHCLEGVRINAYNGTYPNTFAVTNSLFDTCNGYAVNVTAPPGQLGFLANNGSRNCTNGQVPAGCTGLINEGWIALPSDPFEDAAQGDLSLVRGTPAIGAALDGGDLGALQRRFSRLPYPVQY
jgi:hypothetical protein